MTVKQASQPIHEHARVGEALPPWSGRSRSAADTAQLKHDAPDWHARPADEVLRGLEATQADLTAAEADTRLAHHGPNALPAPPRRGAMARLLRQFDNVLIYVLLAAGVATLVLGHVVDAGVIVGVVLLPAMQAVFGTAGLDLAAWSRIGAFAVFLLLVVEGEKWLFGIRRGSA